MNSKTLANGILRALGVILGIALILYFLFKIQSVIIYIAIAAVISLIGRPIILFLRKKLKFNNTLSVVVTMVLLLGLLVGLVGLFIPLIVEQGHNLSLLNIEQLQLNVEDLYDQIITYFEFNNIDVEQSIKDLLSRYFVGLIFQILILFVIYTVVLLIFRIDNAIVIAFLCALLNLVPYVGPLVSGFLMLLLSMSSNLGENFSDVILPKTTYVMIGFIIAQLVDSFFSQPYIFSKSVKSHPLEIFLVIIIAGILFGVVGMIVAVPTYTAIKVILKEFLSDYNIVKKFTKGL